MQVNVPRDDARYGRLEIVVEAPSRLLIGSDLAEYHSDRSGRSEIRLRTPRADQLALSAAP